MKHLLLICDTPGMLGPYKAERGDSEVYIDSFRTGLRYVESRMWDRIIVAGKLPKGWTIERLLIFCRPENLTVMKGELELVQ